MKSDGPRCFPLFPFRAVGWTFLTVGMKPGLTAVRTTSFLKNFESEISG